MGRGQGWEESGTRHGFRWNAWGSGAGGLRGSVMGVGVVGALLAGAAERCLAQDSVWRLTVRPHQMATGTRNKQAGVHSVDGQLLLTGDEHSLPAMLARRYPPPDPQQLFTGGPVPDDEPWIYVPQQCVGTKRCPLVFITNVPDTFEIHIADKYGMITAALSENPFELDRELKTVLQTFAIDPDRIAILGRCATGPFTAALGAANPDVFNRVVVGTPDGGDPPVKTPARKTEYFLAVGILEGSHGFAAVQRLRERGYTVTRSAQFRGHTHTYEEYDFMGRWLQHTWAIPDPAARPAPYTFGDPPLLTSEIVAQMAAFWTRFVQEPDSIKITARQALVREVLIPLGTQQVSTLMVEMPALAAKYPSVAAALKAANLTPEQHEIYRAALAGVRIYQGTLQEHRNANVSRDSATTIVRTMLGIAPNSTIVKNFEFMSTHPDAFKALEQNVSGDYTSMWNTP